jgi:hypothetical protein
MRRQWIKLWIEILSDPVMQRLPDNLWRFTVELFLAAGAISDEEDEGYLTPTDCVSDLAFRLRRTDEQVKEYIGELLKKTKILEERHYVNPNDDSDLPTTYIVVRKFSERQKVLSATERSRYHRNQNQEKS